MIKLANTPADKTDICSNLVFLFICLSSCSTNAPNIAGKYLKAEQLNLAREVFISNKSSNYLEVHTGE